MSKHLHKSASCGVRGLMAVLCLAFSMQWASADEVTVNTAITLSSSQTNTDYIAASGGSMGNTSGSIVEVKSITVNKPTALTIKSQAQYGSWYAALHGNGIVNFQQTDKANSREGITLKDELFEGNFRWTAAKSLMYITGTNSAGAYGMPNGTFTFMVTGTLYGSYGNNANAGSAGSNPLIKIGQFVCDDAYSGSSIGGSGFQLGTTNTTWEIGAKTVDGAPTDSYLAAKIVDGQMKGGYNGYTGIRKVGAGSLTLTNAGSTYTLGTEILEGGIYVNTGVGKNGLGTGNVTVREGAFLGGNATITNKVSGNGATLRPGTAANTVGTLTLSNAAVAWGGGYIDIDIMDNNLADSLYIVANSLTFPANTVRVYVAKDFNVGDEFEFIYLKNQAGDPLPLPKFAGIETVGVGPEATQIPVFDLDYLNQTGKLKITGFSMFSKTPRKLAGICAGASAELEVATLLEGVSFTWYCDGSEVATGETYSASAAGSYLVKAEKGASTEEYAFEVRESANPSTIAQGTSYRTDGDSIFVTPKAGETIEAWQWYMATLDAPTVENPLDFEINPKYVMSTSGYYAADIYNELGCMTHLESTLVRFEPSITSQPQGNTDELCEGDYHKMNIAATTQAIDGIINYQWHYLGEDKTVEPSENTAIAGETGTSYVARQSGWYVVYLSDARGYTYSEPAYVNITAIDIQGMPTSNVSACGSDYLLSVEPVSATSGVAFAGAAYQWFKDGAAIDNSGAAQPQDLTITENGSYAVEVTVGSCVKKSKAYDVVLTSAAEITKDLTADAVKVCAGDELTLSIEAAAAAGTLTYQWYNGDEAIRGAQSASFNPTESGEYSVVISVDGQCETPSTVKEVTILKVPTIRTQPAAPEYVEGFAGSLCDGQIGELEVYAVDVDSYQWYKDGQPVAGADKADFETQESGVYYVVLSNSDLCQTKSDEVTFTAKVTPTSHIDFNYPAVCEGMLFELIPTYADVVNKYVWFKDGDTIPGAIVSSYSTRTNGVYYVEASNECGVANSNSVTINTFVNPSVLINLKYSTLSAVVTDPNPNTVKYQWTLDEMPIEGATANSYMVKKNGNYAVIVENENGCTTTSTTKLIASGITAADDDIALQAVTAYPNPSTGIFKIQGMPTDAKVLVQVDNLAGATVFSNTFNGQSEVTIDLNAAPAGMYFVKIVYGNNTITKKVTIEK